MKEGLQCGRYLLLYQVFWYQSSLNCLYLSLHITMLLDDGGCYYHQRSGSVFMAGVAYGFMNQVWRMICLFTEDQVCYVYLSRLVDEGRMEKVRDILDDSG